MRSLSIYAGSNNIGSVAWYKNNSETKIHKVSEKQPNMLRIYDMSGNINEWCWDWFDDYPSGRVIDPTGPSSGERWRIIRGGGFLSEEIWCRLNVRSAGIVDEPETRLVDVGFRVVRDP